MVKILLAQVALLLFCSQYHVLVLYVPYRLSSLSSEPILNAMDWELRCTSQQGPLVLMKTIVVASVCSSFEIKCGVAIGFNAIWEGKIALPFTLCILNSAEPAKVWSQAHCWTKCQKLTDSSIYKDLRYAEFSDFLNRSAQLLIFWA